MSQHIKKHWLWSCHQLRYCNLSIQYYAFCETCGCGVESNFGMFSSLFLFPSNTEYEHEEFHSSPVKAVLCHPIWFQDALTSTDSILWMRPNLMFNNKRQKTIDVNTRTFCILFLVIFGQLLTSFYDHWISYSQSYYQVLWDHKCDL